MNRKNIAVSVCVALAFIAQAASAQAAVKKISKPFEYSGYSEEAYKGYEKQSVYVEVRDGTKLAMDIFVPAGGPPKQSFPVVFMFLPYSRAFVYPNMPGYLKPLLKIALGVTGPVVDAMAMFKDSRLLVKHGYVYVIADMRGTGASFGRAFHPIPENPTDVEDLLKWIEKQKWCDGNIGMFGGSYLGYIQFVAASRQIKSLKCIAPAVAPLGFSDLAYRGGIYSQEFLKDWSDIAGMLNMNKFIPKRVYPLPIVLPAAPVIDEDGDGNLSDEVPTHDENGSFMNAAPKYKDEKKRDGVYYKATMEHKDNVAFASWVGDVKFADMTFPEPYSKLDVYSLGVHTMMPKIMETKIPIYNLAGWHDANVRGAAESLCTLGKTNPSKMLIGAAYHTGTGPYWKYNGVNEKKVLDGIAVEHLRYFDRYLKNIDNGIDREPPVTIFVQNEGWRAENEWPLKREVSTDFFLVEGQSLSTKPGAAGADKYKADFHNDSRYGSHLGNRYLSAAGFVPDELAVRTEKDKVLFSYDSAVLEKNVEVTGHPIIDLFVSADVPDADFYVYLEDIEPSGRVVLVTEGQLRAGFSKQIDNDLMGRGGIDILPDLPWFGYEKKDYMANVFEGGRVVELKFDLMPTSWIFRAGHRIRITIANADWPTFRLHEKLSPKNNPDATDNILPTVTIHRDDAGRSRVILPVIPR